MLNQIKTVVVGDSNVGKTCIAIRAARDEFPTDISATVGGAQFSLELELNSETVKFNIWDTAGQEEFRTLVPLYFQNAVLAIIVFDITKKETFQNLDVWVRLLNQGAPENVLKVLVGNKIDCNDHRQVTYDAAMRYSKQIEAVTYVETSAKTGQGIHELFEKLAVEIEKRREDELNIPQYEQPKPIPQKDRKSCC
ncbi:small GTP-binding protein [Histomonas meleagridis]|uniref:small GTP-binding protein n=1 Tax=Histomonas meleagridis TaxID=135588 RepID=UPI00355A3C3B|nr:small GTP-binding protein [Histomonas meleagridis]KAH0796278.1 small GTP-binding protein [Histomonas meleagridis]